MEFQDYYATLGIARDATADQVKRAFRRLARKHHPDLNAGDRAAEERFKAINEAYEVLGDADARRKYDELGANWKLYEQAQAAGRDPFAGAGPAAGGGRGTRVRTMSEDDVRRLFGDERFSDFFRTFFGAETRWTGRDGWRAGPDVERELELTLEQAFGGVTRRITVRDGGSTRTLDVRVPPGVDDGSRVRVPGARLAAGGGSPSGDLYLRVRIAPHEVYTRRGRDLHMRAPFPLTTAVLGGEVGLRTIAGGSVTLKVPPATQPGQVFRVKGHGMPALQGGACGDLYATADVRIPDSLTPEERRHFEALAALADVARGGEATPGAAAA